MKNEQYHKYLYYGLTGFGAIALSVLFFFFIFKLNEVNKAFNNLISILLPFIYGAIIAYLLAPVCNTIQNKLIILLSNKIKSEERVLKLSNILSVILSVLLAFFVIYILASLVIPEVRKSIEVLYPKILTFIADMETSTRKFFANPVYQEGLTEVYESAQEYIKSWITEFISTLKVENLFNEFSSRIINLFQLIKNLLIGIIVSIYLLSSRKWFAAQAKKMIYSCFKVPYANAVIRQFRFTHKTFGGFINGKLLDSFIIGVLCFIVVSIMGLQNTMLISVIIGVTNIIPFFGPFIGAVPCALLIFIDSPRKCIYFIIFIIILQQIDGNIIGPKILGDSTGLSGFWVLFAIMLFSGLFGFVGMIIGVPVFAVIYNFISSALNISLRKKGLSESTKDYLKLDYINENNNTFVE